MQLTQRQIVLAVFGMLNIMNVIAFVPVLLGLLPDQTSLLIVNSIVTLTTASLTYAYWHGWDYARHIIVTGATLVIPLLLREPYLTQELTLLIFLPPILALVIGGPLWVLGSAGGVLSLFLAQSRGQGIYTHPVTVIHFLVVVAGLVLARMAMEAALHAAQHNAQQAQEARERAEQQANVLQQKAVELEQRSEQQQRLLDLVATLETPAVPLADGVLFAPITGHMDSQRVQALTARLLQATAAQHAKLIILDIAGVKVIDQGVARGLLQTTQALRLLGCDVTLSGISANVAMTLIQLGINLDGLNTARSPQEALAQHFATMKLQAKTNGHITNN